MYNYDCIYTTNVPNVQCMIITAKWAKFENFERLTIGCFLLDFSSFI